ncbi:MAG: hypothetical protein AAF726_23150 [Planctomycetota bacterium]
MYKRKRKLINKALQLKLVGTFSAIGATCALFQVVLINFGLLDVAKGLPGGGAELLQEARWMMLENVLWTFGALIPLMTGIGIMVTFRIAGPAYRMQMHLNEIAEGGPVRPCKIRKGDELQDLCDALNAALERISPSGDGSEDFTEEWKLESTPSPLRTAGSGSGAQSESSSKASSKDEATADDAA